MTPRMQRCLRPAILCLVGLLILIFMIPNYMSLLMPDVSALFFWDDDGNMLPTEFSAYGTISFGDRSPASALEGLLREGGSHASATFFLTFVAILMLFALIVTILMIAWGILCFLKEFDVFDITETIHIDERIEKRIPMLILGGNAGIHALSAFLTLLCCLLNLHYSAWDSDILIGLQPGTGLFLLLFLSMGAFAGVFVMDRKGLFVADGLSSVTYECSVCKAKAKSSSKFCPTCGGPVVSIESVPDGSVCPVCGARLKPNDKFCAGCGAATPPRKDICASCGAKLKPGAQFCSVCGATAAHETTAAPRRDVCASCGAELKSGSQFCPVCGASAVPHARVSRPGATGNSNSNRNQP